MAHPKGVLIERLQKEGRQPRFETEMNGPDHEPVFDAEVFVDDESLGTGRGTNKRTAERLAAEEALATLDAREAAAAAEADTAASGRGGRRSRGGKGGKRGAKRDANAEVDAHVAADGDADGEEDRAPREAATRTAVPSEPLPAEAFDGPWPVFDSVLATSLRIAHERVAVGLGTDDARAAIEAFALQIYKNVLSDLGEVVEEEVEERVSEQAGA